MVEYCLENYPETRNSDIKLTNKIWIEFYPEYVHTREGKYCVDLVDLYELPKEDRVKRWRAKYQNEKGIYLPDDPEVRRKREITEEKWRKYLGYNPEMRAVLVDHSPSLV